MNRQEFEKALKVFETEVKKRLPSMINITLANRGSREHEFAFRQFIEGLERQRRALLKAVTKVARHAQKLRFMNAGYNMDSQLRSMEGKEAFKRHMRTRHKTIEAPVLYDAGSGPKEGRILNITDDGMLLKTSDKIAPNQELKVSLSGKDAKAKAVWSLTTDDGGSETELRLIDVAKDLIKELETISDLSKDPGDN